MQEFRPGRRVRVKDLPDIVLDAGRTGTVVWARQDAAEAVALCQVHLDGDQAVYTVFWSDELEPETVSTA